jgi:hypothetical protein
MSADLPEQRHDSPMHMARALVTYLKCPREVRRAILQEFGSSPGITSIERMRADYLERKARPDPDPAKPHEGYYPLEASKLAELSNGAFLLSLRRAHPDRFAL